MIIHTPRLCSEPVFLEGQDRASDPTSIIDCRPVVHHLQTLVDPPKPPAAPPVEVALDPIPATEPALEAADAGKGADAGKTTGKGAGSLLDKDGFEVLHVVYDPETGTIQATDARDGQPVGAGIQGGRVGGAGEGEVRLEDLTRQVSARATHRALGHITDIHARDMLATDEGGSDQGAAESSR